MFDPLASIKAALADRYPVERELGRGGMATVYLAHDLKHHRSVAIKVLNPELASMLGPGRFLREIELAAKLSHPHILPLYDSGQVDGLLYYVMPYVEGESLRDRLARDKQLPINEAVRLTQQIAASLDYAHRHGVIHRDIKPENIMIAEGQPMVADFGIALALSEAGGERLTGTGLTIGTPYYMSPEQASGDRQLDARSDIYSLGCVLYEMLAGETPHTGSSAQAVLARVLTEPPKDVRKLRGTVSPALERAVSKSLARLPADRYETAAEFAAALAKADDGPTVSGPTEIQPAAAVAASGQPVRTMNRLPRLARIAPWAVAAFALGVAVLSWLRPGSEMPVPVNAEVSPASAEVAPVGVEVSTEEFKQILAAEQAIVLDTRPHLEYAISHIPGALNVAARPGVPMSMYISDVAEIGRLVGGELTRPLVLYCNGPLCPRSTRISGELEAAGFANVRRYQLGIPIWRAFGGVTVIEAEGLRHVLSLDHTAVVVDAREKDIFKGGSLPGAVNLPRSAVLEGKDVGEIRTAKDDGRLPMSDHNTRVIVVGRTAGDARFVAQAIANEAFHNVAYFPGTFEEAGAALKP